MSRSIITAGANVRLELRDIATGRVEVEELHNLVTDVGLGMVRDLLAGAAYPVTHIELGTGQTAPAAGDTALQTPEYRGTITRREATGTGTVEFQLFLGTGDGNGFDYWETGLFEAGAGDTDPGDPGRLFARAKFSAARSKTSGIELTIIWSITVGRP